MQPQGFEFPAGRRHRLPRVPSNSLRTLPLIEREQKRNYARNGILKCDFHLEIGIIDFLNPIFHF